MKHFVQFIGIALFLSKNVPSETTLNDQYIFEAEIEKYIQIPKADLDSDPLAWWKIYKSDLRRAACSEAVISRSLR